MKITEKRLRKLIRKAILSEKKWSDFRALKGEIIQLIPKDFLDDAPEGIRDLNDEIFDLIQKAYEKVPLGDGTFGNAKVRNPKSMPAGYTIMQAADIDGDPEPDYFRGGKMKKGRYKLGIVGHDGSRIAIDKYLEETANHLRDGAIAELSGAIAHIMITKQDPPVPAVQTHEEVEGLLGKKVEWIGRHPDPSYAAKIGPDYECWYCRDICNAKHMKILLGGG